MPSVKFEERLPLGVRFTIRADEIDWFGTVLNEALLVLPGADFLEAFNANKPKLAEIAVAKISIGETFDGEVMISLADLRRPDLQRKPVG